MCMADERLLEAHVAEAKFLKPASLKQKECPSTHSVRLGGNRIIVAHDLERSSQTIVRAGKKRLCFIEAAPVQDQHGELHISARSPKRLNRVLLAPTGEASQDLRLTFHELCV